MDTNRLLALFNAGRYAELESSTRKLIELHPHSGLTWSMLGLSLKMQGKNALQALEMAAQLSPDDAVTHYNLGNVQKELGQFQEAMASYHRALQIHPDLAEAHNNLGNVLSKLWQLNEAVASYRRVLKIRPDSAKAHFNLGSALKDAGEIDEAIASYRRALEIDPDYVAARSDLLFSYNYRSDLPPPALTAEARRFGALATRQARPYSHWANTAIPDRCLRIGLVSGDFRNHPVGYFVEGMLAALASNASGRLEFFAYFNHADSDALTERVQASCHGWHSTVALSDESLARRIREDGIDILIDLAGHTAHNRLPTFAWKPAPVQASWLGYFATTGCAAMDYFIADPWTAPESEAPYFTEQIWRLPETRLCFTPPDVDVEVCALPALQNAYITFGCFNNLSKMNDAVVALWARVLHAVPGSRLFLKAAQLNEATARDRTVERFAIHGIAAGRLILEGASARAAYLAAYHKMDIALDPFPYTGGATTVDSLWMGVPVLTMSGDRFISRQSAGLLANAGLHEWIASDADVYVDSAVRHATDLQGLAVLRSGLRQQVLASPILDSARFARHLEAALRNMWRQWCSNQRPT